MTPPGRGAPEPAPRPGRALAAGAAVVAAYLAGAVLSGQLSVLARRPLLDGLAPPSRYRWVRPPAELAQGNKPPTPMHDALDLEAGGSKVAFDVVPLDPATVAPAPAGLLAAGNAYRFTASYQPTDRQVDKLSGEASASVVYPLLSTPVANQSGHVLLYSKDGKAAWTRLASTDAPAVHQVTARLPGPGYYLAAVPRASAAATTARALLNLLRAAVPFVVLVAAFAATRVVLRRRRRAEAQRRMDAKRRADRPKPTNQAGPGAGTTMTTSKRGRGRGRPGTTNRKRRR